MARHRTATGAVAVDGVPVAGPRNEVGLVFQEPRLMPWLNVRDNVEFALLKRPKDQRRALADKALARVGLTTFADALLQQYTIDLPRPRRRTESGFMVWKERILEDLDLARKGAGAEPEFPI